MKPKIMGDAVWRDIPSIDSSVSLSFCLTPFSGIIGVKIHTANYTSQVLTVTPGLLNSFRYRQKTPSADVSAIKGRK